MSGKSTPALTLKTNGQVKLPVLPSGAPSLLKAITDEEIDFSKLAIIIERFPTISARLISLSNSAWSAPACDITSLDMACARLGFSVVRSVGIALSIALHFNPNRCPAFDAEKFWCSSFLSAKAAAELALVAKIPSDLEPQTVRTAGLLHNLGLLYLADQMPQETGQAINLNTATPGLPLKEALRDFCGYDHCEAGGCLGKSWNLPELLVSAMTHHDMPDYDGAMWQSAILVGSANSMVSALYRGKDWSAENLRFERLNIKPADGDEIFTKMSAKFEDTRELAKMLFTTA